MSLAEEAGGGSWRREAFRHFGSEETGALCNVLLCPLGNVARVAAGPLTREEDCEM